MIAEVIINSNVKTLNKTFDYIVPDELLEKVYIGARVYVPFGRKKELEDGYIISLKETSDFEIEKLKSISKIEEKEYLDESKIQLSKWMAERYFSNVSDSIKLFMPPGKTNKKIENQINDKMQNFIMLNKEIEDIEDDLESGIIKSEKQKRVLEFLIENGDNILSTDLENFADVDMSVLRTLEKKEYITIDKYEVRRNPFENKDEIKRDTKLELNEDQEKAFSEIQESIDDGLFNEYLLYGITGSGKTEIYLQAIEETLNLNKNIIMLVPEISLTPQTVNRFIARFGKEEIAILHSKLSIGERYDEWKKIKEGNARIVIGARSAIFAPIKNLGLIIIDEEHDDSYKSETSPRYDAREIAEYLAKENDSTLILGSATPDLKTYYRALKNEIGLLELPSRANDASLPEVKIVDLREELAAGNRSMISNILKEKIEENIKNKKQTILFLNRRGFSTFVMCRDCGYVCKCKNCDITLTYHKNDNKLKCHYCGHEENIKTTCPECGSKNIRYFGTGTQKLEEEINKLFPNASTIRMDIDTVTKKNSHEDIINKFKNDNIDILIGTQMVVKGHHFENVTLVGIIAADLTLNIDDYRAEEKTFQTITQVAGRAGRGKDKGTVIIQTYNPEAYSIEIAKEQDYKKFYNMEVEIRKSLKYPPFCDIMLIQISGKNSLDVKRISNLFFNKIKNRINYQNENGREKVPIICYKPVPSPLEKIKNKYRWRIIVKCLYDEKVVSFIKEIYDELLDNELKKDKFDTRLYIDINPRNML